MSSYEFGVQSTPVDDVEYEKSVARYYKHRVIFNVLEDSLSSTAISEPLKKNLLLDFMPKSHADQNIPKQQKQVKSSLSMKDCETLRNHVQQQILSICEPLISLSKSLLKLHPRTFDESFTNEKQVESLVERRKSLIESILEAKRRKCELLIRVIERRVAPENVADLEKMLMKFRLRELKAKAMDMTVLKSIETEDSHTLAAYREVEKHLDEMLRSRGLDK